MELRGGPSLGITQISLKAIEKILREDRQGMLIELKQAGTSLLLTAYRSKIPKPLC